MSIIQMVRGENYLWVRVFTLTSQKEVHLAPGKNENTALNS